MLSSEQISAVQTALNEQGYNAGSVTGEWNNTTAQAWTAWGTRNNVPAVFRRRQPETPHQTFGLVSTRETDILEQQRAAEEAARQAQANVDAAMSAARSAQERALREAQEAEERAAQEAADQKAAADAAALDNAVKNAAPAEDKKGSTD